MDCYNYNCPFRFTQLPTSATRCDCIACQNRYTETTYIVSNRTLTTKEIEEQLKKKYETDWNYGRGEGC
jgi:hypothetical protein